LLGCAIQPVEKPGGFRPARPCCADRGEDEVHRRSHWGYLAALAALAAALDAAPAAAQSPPWLDSTLLAAAKAEGSLIVYSSTNRQEGLPLFKLFTDATGIKVEYVRASDAVLMSRMSIEFRADQKSYDVLQTATINKMPLQMLAEYEPPEARNISPDARDPN